MKRKTSIPGNFDWERNLLRGAAFVGILFFGVNGSAQPQPATATDISNPASQASPSRSDSQTQQLPRPAVSLRIVVTDARQHSLAGATCSLIDSRKPKAIVATAVTNEEGVATFTALPSGSYTLRVENNGFETFIKNDA